MSHGGRPQDGKREEKAWAGRLGPEGGRAAEAFCASLPFDRRLWREDLEGSRAHLHMLGRQGILTAEEVAQLEAGLRAVEEELEAGTFPFRLELEDIHLNIERRLIELVGPVGGKLHTGRSRNDQVALDEHLFLRRAGQEMLAAIRALMRALLDQAKDNLGVLAPGYTHLQRAQPTLLSHHLLAFVFMFERDRERVRELLRRYDRSPLGAAALAGTPHPIAPEAVAAELGFSGVYDNSLDATSSRDHVLDFLYAAAMVQMHLSRLAEEVVLWSTHEFGFVELDDAYCTGSSIMPQKKNPDVAELIRGKAGRVYGDLLALLTTLKGLPLGYASDLQEDKERLFDACDTVLRSLEVAAGMVATLRFRRDRLEQATRDDLSTATDLADYLAERGVPFREAHAAVGRLVRHLLAAGRRLEDLTVEELQQFHGAFGADALARLRPEQAVEARATPGGTSRARVEEQIARAEALLAQP